MEKRKVENKSLFQGDNDFETGILTVAAGVTVPAGAFLKRNTNGKFSVVTDTGNQTPCAVNPVEVKNTGTTEADIPFRALTSGKVRQDMLSVNGEAITDAEADMIRIYGIRPKKVTDLSWVD